MTEYFCVIRDRHGFWVTSTSLESQEDARDYGESFGDLVALIAKRTGIRPPVGMRADQASHEMVFDCFPGVACNVIQVPFEVRMSRIRLVPR